MSLVAKSVVKEFIAVVRAFLLLPEATDAIDVAATLLLLCTSLSTLDEIA
ncbi:hypothetical protein PC123_g16157 [Phytophthora cactorum]|nr:hypothetical protein PC123_g16157 [Phytophthora cactorum]